MDVLFLKKKIAEAHKLTQDNLELKKQLEERNLHIKELEESQKRNGNIILSEERIRAQSSQIRTLERQREIEKEKARDLEKQLKEQSVLRADCDRQYADSLGEKDKKIEDLKNRIVVLQPRAQEDSHHSGLTAEMEKRAEHIKLLEAKLEKSQKQQKSEKAKVKELTEKLSEKELKIKQFKEQIKGLKASNTNAAKYDKAVQVEFGSSVSAAKSELEKLKADTALEAKKSKSAKFIPFFGMGIATKRAPILFHKYGKCSGESRFKVPSLVIGNSHLKPLTDMSIPGDFCPSHASQAAEVTQKPSGKTTTNSRKRKIVGPPSVAPNRDRFRQHPPPPKSSKPTTPLTIKTKIRPGRQPHNKKSLFSPAKSTAADISTDAVTSSSESEVESECPSSLQASPRRNTRPPLQLPGSESLNPDAKGSQKGNTTGLETPNCTAPKNSKRVSRFVPKETSSRVPSQEEGASTDDNAETDGNIPKNLDTSGSLNTSTDSVSVKKASPKKLWKNTSKPSEENIRDSTLLMDTSRDLDISTEVEPIANKFPSKRAENLPKDNAQTTNKLDTSSDSLPGPGRPPVTKTPVSTPKEKTQRSTKMSFVSGGTLVPLGKRVTTPNTERAATLGRSHSTPSSAVPHWSKALSGNKVKLPLVQVPQPRQPLKRTYSQAKSPLLKNKEEQMLNKLIERNEQDSKGSQPNPNTKAQSPCGGILEREPRSQTVLSKDPTTTGPKPDILATDPNQQNKRFSEPGNIKGPKETKEVEKPKVDVAKTSDNLDEPKRKVAGSVLEQKVEPKPEAPTLKDAIQPEEKSKSKSIFDPGSDEEAAEATQTTSDADVLHGDLSLSSGEDSPDEEVGKEMSNQPGKSISSKKDDTGSTLKPDTEKPQSVAVEVPPEEEDDKTSKSLLERIFSSFNEGYNHRQLELLKKKRSYQEKVWRDAPENAPDDSQQAKKGQPCHSIARAAVQVQLGRLWSGVNTKETLENIVGQLATVKGLECDFKRFLIQLSYVAVREETEPWKGVKEVSNCAPLLTDKQSKLLSLIILLATLGKDHDHQIRNYYKTLPKELVLFIRHRTFAADCYFQYKQSQLANISRFFMALVRYLGDEVAAKAYLFDVFYHKNNRNFVMLTIFFDTWPEILLWTGTTTSVLNPLLETIVWAIYNTGPPNSLAELKVFETRYRLANLCGLPKPNGVSGVDMVKHFIDTTEKKFSNKDWTEATKLSLLLLAKVQEFQWAHNNIVRRLLEIFAKYMSGSSGASQEQTLAMLAWVVDTVGLISRVYPVDPAREKLTEVFDAFAKLLSSGHSSIMTRELEEACLRALVYTGHNLPVQTTRFLIEWSGPKHKPLCPKTVKLLENYAGTKAYTQSAMTIQRAKKEKVYAQLNKSSFN